MSEQRSGGDVRSDRPAGRRSFLAAVGGAATAGVAGCVGAASAGRNTVTVFHAGSLSPPFAAAEPSFQSETGLTVHREAKGSVGSTQKITEEGRHADVLGVADFRLVRDMMLPAFADWYGVFATNAMAVAYTDDSAYADEFDAGNWWEILSRDDVRVGHSDPAVDPCGYRSVMAMRLGAVDFDGESLYGERTARRLEDNAVVAASTETDLIGQLETGSLDYAWEYRSAGATHESLNVTALQPHVNLAELSDRYADHYASVSVDAGGDTYTGAPIAYGITVPSVAENPAGGRKWVDYLTDGAGERFLRESGFEQVSPMVVPERTADAAPPQVLDGAATRTHLGPLSL
ncbi:extracellular solute-binding protein [Halobaculum sp. P14]|uniref:extracellular solute-binding protein n=1 Tax=Halobaculum sp. P14 TaxID=3421638 RepID=UPI003EB9321E